MKSECRVSRAFNVCFAALFGFTVLDSVCNNQTEFFAYNALLLAAVCAAWCAAGLLAARFVLPRFAALKPKKAEAAAAVVLALYFLLLLGFGLTLQVKLITHWDFGVVFAAAQEFVLHGTLPGEYFVQFGNNAPLYFVLVGFFRLLHALGMQEFMTAAVVLNCVAIEASAVLFYFAARKALGAQYALPALLCGCGCLAYVAYTPIVYTDTLTLPFPIAAVLLWLCARQAFAQKKTRRALGLCAALGMVTAVGAQLKITVAIVMVAVAIDALLQCAPRAKWQSTAVLAASFAAVYTLAGVVVWHTGTLPARDKTQAIPYTHWVMMGLHENGNYYDPDYQLTLSADTYTARVALNLRESKARIEAMGPGGFLRHLADKQSFVWGDGTFYAPVKLRQAPERLTLLHRLLIYEFNGFSLTAYCFTGLHLAALLWMVAGAVADARKKAFDLMFVRVAVTGLALFLLVWEARSRYLVNFMPLVVLCAASGLVKMSRAWYNNRKLIH